MSNRQSELTNILREAADAYYNDTEIMTDREYDALADELAELERKSGTSLPGSVVANVGANVTSGLRKVSHETPMLSLAKTKDRASLATWLDGHKGCISWKLDGSTVVLTYEDGKLVQAVTRGNGHIGEDITKQAELFSFVPQWIPSCKGKLVVRGEALMTYAEFERVNASSEYKNPRNLASGTMRSLDLSILRERNIQFHPFELVYMEGMPDSFADCLDLLAEMGFEPVPHYVVDADTIIDKVNEFERMVESCPFPTDGLVLQLDDVAYGRSLGTTGHHPRSGIAFKWADDAYETTLTGIEWQTSRTGRINPVAVFAPVEIDGTTVSRASLHNVNRIRELELGIGDTITVYKANLIIPMVADNLTRSNTCTVPTRCPVCGGTVSVRNDGGTDFIYCDNPDCAAKSVKRFVHFTSRDAMNILGLSDERMQTLVDTGIVRSYSDILDLPTRRNEVVWKVEGWGDGIFDGIASAIESARRTEAARVLYSFGIREVGRSASRSICKEFGNDLEAVMEAALAGDVESFTRIDGIGRVMARELIDYVRDNESMMRDVISRVEITDKGAEDEVTSDFITGKTFVITGSVHTFANRSAFKAYVESMGGKVAGSVSKKTSYLVTNTPDSGSSKNRRARELGIPVITEDEFCASAGYGSKPAAKKTVASKGAVAAVATVAAFSLAVQPVQLMLNL